MSSPRIIAMVGKGGVGKTSLAALTVRLLSEKYPEKRILAIDADPAVGLATAIGVDAASTVDDIRKYFVKTVEDGQVKAAVEMLSEARYQISDSLVEIKNISFLAIGRPESSGCYCKVNAYLKEIISSIAENFDYVVIDGEAGIEQVNRRVMEKVTDLILVSDASRKGIEVADTVRKVASELIMFDKCGLIINRMPDMSMIDSVDIKGMKLLACIPDDKSMTFNDMQGNSIFMLPENSPVFTGLKNALENSDGEDYI